MANATTSGQLLKRVKIWADTGTRDSPRDWDNSGTMVCWHNRYNLGDEQPNKHADEWLRDYAADLVDAYPENLNDDNVQAIIDKHAVILPLFLYDHSGLAMSVGGFSDPWDSGQVGYIVCSLADARKNWMIPDANWDTPINRHNGESVTMREYTRIVLTGEVETYDTFLRGDVYGFTIEVGEQCDECGDIDWDFEDSCGGFYGSDPSDNGMMDHMPDDITLDMVREAFEDVEYR